MNPRAPYRVANALYDKDYIPDLVSPPTTQFFDVSSDPIRTQYGQVHWRLHSNISLPDHVVQQFRDKIMAVVGYEVDQVAIMEIKNKDDNEEAEPFRIPISWAYNHHYGAFLHADELVHQNTNINVHSHGPLPGLFQVRKNDDDNNDPTVDPFIPAVQFFSEANGGEMRGSWHGYPHGYAQLIQSPTTFGVIPMQIDTWDRAHQSNTNSGGNRYQPSWQAPLPKAISSRNRPLYTYNPLLECPCTDRLEKEWHLEYSLDETHCNNHFCISSAEECFGAAPTVMTGVPSSWFRNVTTRHNKNDKDDNDANCSVRLVPSDHDQQDFEVHVVWKEVATTAAFTDEKSQDASIQASAVERLVETSVNQVRRPTALRASTTTRSNDFVAWASSVQDRVWVQVRMKDNNDNTDNEQDLVEITLRGPADVWFAVGWGSASMCLHYLADECPSGGPYALLVLPTEAGADDNDDAQFQLQERKLDYHGPGRILEPSVTVVSHTTNDETNQRTIVLTRPVQGRDNSYYSFLRQGNESAPSAVDLILATGCGPQFAQHCGHGSSRLNFLATEQPAPLCGVGIRGSIDGSRFDDSPNRCPRDSDLLRQENPTCTVQTYKGGLFCCRDGHFLLDQDQEAPWPDQYLEYRLKFRFYYQEYHPATPAAAHEKNQPQSTPSHKSLVRLYHQTEANAGEYDVPQCPPGTPPSHCVHVLTARWSVRDMMVDCPLQDPSWCTGVGSSNSSLTKGVELIYAAPHCHAGTCLSMELYNADTGQLLCGMKPVLGRDSSQPYQEEGYLAIPPCLWSEDDSQLPNPILLPLETNLLSIKRNNNTLPHTGEMASWQMRGVVIPRN